MTVAKPEILKQALADVEFALESILNETVEQGCCGNRPLGLYECCGSPVPEWPDWAVSVMNRLGETRSVLVREVVNAEHPSPAEEHPG